MGFILQKDNIRIETDNLPQGLIELEVISSVISTRSIKQIITSSYGIKKISQCELLQSNIHDTYKIFGDEKNYILKLFNKSWNRFADIEYEINVLNFLKTSSCPVSYPLLSESGQYILKLDAPEGGRYFYLSTYAYGEELDYRVSKNAYTYGQSVANLHQKSQLFKPETYEKKLDVVTMYETAKDKLKLFLLNFPEERAFFVKVTNLLTERIQSFDFSELEHGFCHGDLHGGNVKYWHDKGVFYDFDFCGYGLISYDIAAFKWMSMLRNNDKIWNEFISGYRAVKRLPENELEPIVLFAAIRDIWIMYLFINRVDDMGAQYISKPYIEKRMSFLNKLAEKL